MKNWKFRVRWSGYEPDEDSWLNWNAVKIIRNSNWAEEYARIHWKRSILGKRILFSQVLQEFGYNLRKLGLVPKFSAKPLKGVKIFICRILILGLAVWMGISLEQRARLSEAMWWVSFSLGLN